MTTDDEKRETLARLLAAYGADRTRWPAASRDRFRDLIASDAEAQRLVREAEALDGLLQAADASPAAVSADLVARVMQRAAEVPRAKPMPREPADVVDIAARRAARRVPQSPGYRSEWRAAAVLAASLAFGLYIGGQGLGSEVVTGLGDITNNAIRLSTRLFHSIKHKPNIDNHDSFSCR